MLRREFSNLLMEKMTLMAKKRRRSLLSLKNLRKLRSTMMMRGSSSGKYRVAAVKRAT